MSLKPLEFVLNLYYHKKTFGNDPRLFGPDIQFLSQNVAYFFMLFSAIFKLLEITQPYSLDFCIYRYLLIGKTT